MNLLEMIMGSMSSKLSVDSLSKKSGGTSSQISALISKALPLLMNALTKNASTESGAASLSKALTQHTSTASVESQIKNADMKDGEKILKHILGGDFSSVMNNLSKETGMEEVQVEEAMDSLAPAMMSELSAASGQAKKKNESGLDLGSLLSMFGGSGSGAADLLKGLMGGASKSKSQADGSALLESLMGFMK